MTRSGGPVTQEGKEVVRWNATRHGISSPASVVPEVEKKEDWEEHRDGALESLSPVGHLECVGRKGGAALLAVAPCHPLRTGGHRLTLERFS